MEKQVSLTTNHSKPISFKACSIAALWLTTLVFFLTACNATPSPLSPNPTTITIAGSTSIKPLMVQLANAYRKDHPSINFDIQDGNSQLGWQLVNSNQVDIGTVSGPIPHSNEQIRYTPIARDNVAIIINSENLLIDLSLRELKDVFSGKILDWREIDGLAAPVQVVVREGGSGTRAVFEAAVMDDLPVTTTAVVMPGNQAVVDFVAKNTNAVGYVSTVFLDQRIRSVTVDGASPTLNSLQTTDYFLTRELILAASAQSRPEVNQFLEFILSSAGQKIVAKNWSPIR